MYNTSYKHTLDVRTYQGFFKAFKSPESTEKNFLGKRIQDKNWMKKPNVDHGLLKKG
jgi:hypothetical protein